jgi:hypothetical protein
LATKARILAKSAIRNPQSAIRLTAGRNREGYLDRCFYAKQIQINPIPNINLQKWGITNEDS